MFPFRNFTVDHIIPQCRGGTDHLENLMLFEVDLENALPDNILELDYS